jgi:hypothetical protein
MINPLLILLSFATLSGHIKKESDKEAVARADRELNSFILQHESGKAASYYAEEFILTTSSGKVKLKKDMLNEIASADLSLAVNETTNVSVRILHNTAVLTGILHQQGSYKGKTFDVKLNVTDTWVKTGKRWSLLSGHATLLP